VSTVIWANSVLLDRLLISADGEDVGVVDDLELSDAGVDEAHRQIHPAERRLATVIVRVQRGAALRLLERFLRSEYLTFFGQI